MSIVLGDVPKICIRDKLDSRQNETYRDYRDFGDRPQCAFGPIISRQRFLVSAFKRITSRRLAVDKSEYNSVFGSPVDKESRQQNQLALRQESERPPSISDNLDLREFTRFRRAPASPLTPWFRIV